MAIAPTLWTPATPEWTPITVAGQDFNHHTPRKPYSFASDNNLTRFEIRKGDQYAGQYADSAGTERCEIGQVARPAINQLITTEYKFMIEPGAKITARWMVIGQMHSALNASPPLQIAFRGNDRMLVLGASGPSTSPSEKVLFSDTQEIIRGKWYTMKLAVWLSSKGNGNAYVTRNGIPIVDYVAPLGYADQTATYWKMGVYRSTAPETVAVNYKDLSIKVGNVPDVVVPAPVVVEPPPIIAPDGSNTAGYITGLEKWAQSVEARLKALEAK